MLAGRVVSIGVFLAIMWWAHSVRAEPNDAKLVALEGQFASLKTEVDGFERFSKPRWLLLAELNGPGWMAGATEMTSPLSNTPGVGFGSAGLFNAGITFGAGIAYLTGQRAILSYSFLPDLSASKSLGLLNVSFGHAEWFGVDKSRKLPDPAVIRTWNPPHSWGYFNDIGVGWAHGSGGDGGGLRIRGGLQQYYSETLALEYGLDAGFIVGQERVNRVYLGIAVSVLWQPPR